MLMILLIMNQAAARHADDSRPHGRAGFLAPYRVLDLSDERGLLAGWMLARLGADVVQVEPEAGSSARRVGPFDAAAPLGQNSLYWSAYAAGKRGISCMIDHPDGSALLQRLMACADILIESQLPGATPRPELEVAAIRAAHPRLIHVSITPFGKTGPKAAYADSELVIWAAAGPLSPSRDARGMPLRISVPQAYLHAGADAAAGALVALFARHGTGHGQHVDISAQASASLATLSTTLASAVGHDNFQFPAEAPRKQQQLDLSGSGARTRRSKWVVADGLLELHLGMGSASGGSANRLFAWMKEEGALPTEFHGWDWIKLPQQIMADEISETQIDRAREAVAAFVRPRFKQDLMDVAMQRGILMAPALTTGDLVGSEQLRARGFFETVVEAGRPRTLPARFAAGCDLAFTPLRPAPQLGEHNTEVYAEWLGLAPADCMALARAGSI
jgi:crotonobetainyl-CoA:carnitine CoA-transferase CaiB-like acyl-CoA transferase